MGVFIHIRVLARANFQLDMTKGHLRRKLQLRRYLDQTGLWQVCGILLIASTEVGRPTLNVDGIIK